MAGAMPRPERRSYFIEIVTFLIIGYSRAQVQRLCNGGMNLQMVGRPSKWKVIPHLIRIDKRSPTCLHGLILIRLETDMFSLQWLNNLSVNDGLMLAPVLRLAAE